jgi:hypothetical protein
MLEKEKRRILRKMNRSRMATNPNKYNLDGTIQIGKAATMHINTRKIKISASYPDIEGGVSW